MLDRINRSTSQDRQRVKEIADRYIPAADGAVAPTDNQPERVAIGQAKETMTEVSAFLKETPAITSPEECKAGDAWSERVRINLQSMEDERKPQVEPLNAQLNAINEPYRLVRQPLEKIFAELKRRVTVYKNKVETERQAQADRLRREAEEAARRAEQAAAVANDAIAAADVGVCEDAGAAIFDADQTARDAGRADRAASRAANSVTYRNPSIVGGRAQVMRTVPVINIVDPVLAIKVLCAGGVPDKLAVAMRQSALAFEDAMGELPNGITRTFERRM